MAAAAQAARRISAANSRRSIISYASELSALEAEEPPPRARRASSLRHRVQLSQPGGWFTAETPMSRERKSLLDILQSPVGGGSRGSVFLAAAHKNSAFRRLSQVRAEKSSMHPARMWLHRLVTENKWFDRAALGLITLNCVFLALEDPTDKCNVGTLNRVVATSEYFFAACFTLEMTIRIAALGLYRESFAYLRDPWNVLDAVIVVSGLATVGMTLASDSCSSGAGISGLRAFRLLRPLRAVTHIQEVRLIVASLLQSLPKLGDVLLLFLFFILLVGIIAVQLWRGRLDERCVADESSPEFEYRRNLTAQDDGRVCGTGYKCPWGWTCQRAMNPNKGRTSFDNVLWALLTLFVAVTMEGWTGVMYYVQDSTSWWYCLYFVVLILFGSFFVMNLVLVMIGVAYFDVEMQELERREQMREGERLGKTMKTAELGVLDSLRRTTQMGQCALSDSDLEEEDAAANGCAAGTADGEGAQQAALHSEHSSPATRNSSPQVRASAADTTWVQSSDPQEAGLRAHGRAVVSHRFFVWGITGTIVLNTVSMAVEHHGQPDELTRAAEILNYIFTGIFALESCLKIFSFPWAEFVRDRFNVFDAVIALIALIDIIVLQQQTSQQTGVSVLRSFRLMRMFKLAKQFPTLWTTALTVLRSVEGVSVITLLLLLVIFIYALLGMQFFGGEFCGLEPAEDYVHDSKDFCENLPRSNFDHLGWATISVFQVITGEDWNAVLYNGMCAGSGNEHCSGNPSSKNLYSLYFVSLFIFGNYVTLNLFIAVLISNFSSSRALGPNAQEWLQEDVFRWLETACLPGETDPAGLEHLKTNFDPELNRVLMGAVDGPTLLELEEDQLVTYLQIDTAADRAKLWRCICALREAQGEWAEQQRTGCVQRVRDTLAEFDRALQRRPPRRGSEAGESDEELSEQDCWAEPRHKTYTDRVTATPVSPRRGGVQTLLRVLDQTPPPPPERVSAAVQATLRNPATQTALRPVFVRWRWCDDPPGFETGDKPLECARLREDIVAALNTRRDEDSRAVERFATPGGPSEASARALKHSRKNLRSHDSEQEEEPPPLLCGFLPPPPEENYNVALGFIPSTHPVRMFLRAVVMHAAFEVVVILLILLSTAALAMNNPTAAPDERMPRVLETIDLFLTIAFDVEAGLKIVAHGFLIAPESYLRRDGWNCLDFLIVVISNIALILKDAVANLKVLRMMRTLRPLRFINRSPGLKLVVVSLVRAIPPLANIFLVTFLIFIIFGIMGVQFFSGNFAKCTLHSWGDITDQNNITSEDLCLPPARWVPSFYNYDNLYEALVALFEISTLEGWVVQMHLGMDAQPVARGQPGKSPKKNNQPWMAVYFVIFIVVGCFFIVNLFIGVLIEQYNSSKRASERSLHQGLTEDERLWLTTHELILNNIPPRPRLENMAEWRLGLREQVVANSYLDQFFTACIVLNVCFMGSEHEGQPDAWAKALEIANLVFIGIFTVEFLVKWAALGLIGYFQDDWNRFDFAILVVSAAGAVTDFVASGAPVVGVFRVLRLARLTRVIRTAAGVRALLRTLWLALPGLANVAGLLLLFFFLYAVVGVVIFGRVRRGDCLTDNANFDNFGNALLLLFRMSTGEAWECIMFDCSVMEPHCDPQLGDCGSKGMARIYFVSFIALTFHVLLQVFIAIILSDYENVAMEMNADVAPDDITAFVEEWNRRDPRGTLLLPTCELPLLIKALERRPGPPLGLASPEDAVLASWRHKNCLKAVSELCLDYEGCVFFQEVLFGLVEHNVLAKDWNPELGMDITDPVSWQQRLDGIDARWRLLGYNKPPATENTILASDVLAALKIQTAWRAKLGRRQAMAKAETLGVPISWRMAPGSPATVPSPHGGLWSPGRRSFRGAAVTVATHGPGDGSPGGRFARQPLFRSWSLGSGQDRDANAVGPHGEGAALASVCVVRLKSKAARVREGVRIGNAVVAPAPPPQHPAPSWADGAGAPPLPPAPPEPPPRPPAGRGEASPLNTPAREPFGAGPRAPCEELASAGNSPPTVDTAPAGAPPALLAPDGEDPAEAGTEAGEALPAKQQAPGGGQEGNPRFAFSGIPGGQFSFTTSHSSGPSNITIHNINIHNINIGSPGALSSLPPEIVAELRAAAQQQQQSPGAAVGSEATPPQPPRAPSADGSAAPSRGSTGQGSGEPPASSPLHASQDAPRPADSPPQALPIS